MKNKKFKNKFGQEFMVSVDKFGNEKVLGKINNVEIPETAVKSERLLKDCLGDPSEDVIIVPGELLKEYQED